MSEAINVAKIFGEDVFNDTVMQERLPKKGYKKLKEVINEGKELDLETATARVTYRNHGQSYEHRCFCSAPSQVLVYQIRAEEAFTIVVTAEDGFLTGTSWDGKIWKMQGQMPGKSKIPVGAKEGDGSEFVFSENPQEKGSKKSCP